MSEIDWNNPDMREKAMADKWAAAEEEVERLNRLVDELRAQLKVAESFHRVAVTERDYERAVVANLQLELNRRS